MQLVLIRHGLPERVERTDGAPADPPLCPAGRDQAERVGAWLREERFDRIYSSPLRRALETAEPLAGFVGLEVEPLAAVAEMDAASPTYVPLDELKRTDYAAWRAAVDGGLVAEVDVPHFLATVRAGLEQVIADNPGRRVAVACHAGVINAWAGHVLGLERGEDFLFFEPQYTSVNRFFAASGGERSIGSLNETAHLRGAGDRERGAAPSAPTKGQVRP